MIEVHLIGYTSDLRHLVLDLDGAAGGRYRLVIDADLFVTLDEIHDLRLEAGMDAGPPRAPLVAPDEAPDEAEEAPDGTQDDDAGLDDAGLAEEMDAGGDTGAEADEHDEAAVPDDVLVLFDDEDRWASDGGPGEDTDDDDDDLELRLTYKPRPLGTVRVVEAPSDDHDHEPFRPPRDEPPEPEPMPEPRPDLEPMPEPKPEPMPEPEPEPEPEPMPMPPPSRQGASPAADREPTPAPASEPVRSRLSPAEIQTLLRSGRSPRSVAEKAGTDVAWVERWLQPILEERDRILREARGQRLERPRLGRSHDTLGDAVRRNLEQRRIPLDESTWETNRRADGRWRVTVRYRYRGRQRTASWAYNPRDRSLAASSELAQEMGFTRSHGRGGARRNGGRPGRR